MIKKISGHLHGSLIPALFLPVLAFAQTQIPSGGPQNIQQVQGTAVTLINWVFTFFLLLAVVFIILAAFSYLTAAGDAEKVKTAKNRLIYAIVAIVIAVLARSIVAIVSSLVGANVNVPQ